LENKRTASVPSEAAENTSNDSEATEYQITYVWPHMLIIAGGINKHFL